MKALWFGGYGLYTGPMAGWITDVPGILVGHWTDQDAATGCTAVVCDPKAVGAVDVRGGAPGTRETDALRPQGLVQHVDTVLLTGGSAFGLASATGAMRYLEELDRGFPTPGGRVPIVPAAVLYDLTVGNSRVRPNEQSGYLACQAAAHGAVPEGSVGAGAGATVGKRVGLTWAMRGGIGTASRAAHDGTLVGAIVAVNALGDIFDPETNEWVAGCRAPQSTPNGPLVYGNTTIGVVATDAPLDRVQLTHLAIQAHNGLARCIRPVHTRYDGDTMFALGTAGRSRGASIEELGALIVEAVIEAVLRAVRRATSLPGIPAAEDV